MLELLEILFLLPFMFIAINLFFFPYEYKVLMNVSDNSEIPTIVYNLSLMGLIFLILLLQFNINT